MNFVLPIWRSSVRSTLTVCAAFMLAILHQYLFYGHMPGISVPIFVLFFYAFMIIFAGDRLTSYSKFNGLLSLAIVMLSFTYVLFDSLFFQLLNVIMLPLFIAVHLTVWMGYHTTEWFQLGIIGDTLRHLIPRNFRHFPAAFTSITSSLTENMNDDTRKTVRNIAIGIAISAPLLGLVITLLSSADGLFESFLNQIPNWLDHITYSEGFFRLIWIFVFTLLFFGYVTGFVHPVSSSNKTNESFIDVNGEPQGDLETGGYLQAEASTVHLEQAWIPADSTMETRAFKLDPVITGTVLILINIVYVIFVVLQFSYLFGAWEGSLPEGMTYADYARKGFAELMVVAILNFTILMTALLLTADSTKFMKRVNQLMLYLLVLCSLIILYSAYSRLHLYEEAYGFTYIRFLVHAFMLFLAVLMIIAGLRIHYKQIPLAKCYIILGLIAYVCVNYAGMDSYIAKKNVERYHLTGDLDENFLASLSSDAVPALIEFSKEHPEFNPHLKERYRVLTQQEKSWPSFNIAEYRAKRALAKHFSKVSLVQHFNEK